MSKYKWSNISTTKEVSECPLLTSKKTNIKIKLYERKQVLTTSLGEFYNQKKKETQKGFSCEEKRNSPPALRSSAYQQCKVKAPHLWWQYFTCQHVLRDTYPEKTLNTKNSVSPLSGHVKKTQKPKNSYRRDIPREIPRLKTEIISWGVRTLLSHFHSWLGKAAGTRDTSSSAALSKHCSICSWAFSLPGTPGEAAAASYFTLHHTGGIKQILLPPHPQRWL